MWPGALPISAKTGEGLDVLLDEIRKKLMGIQRPVRVTIPYAQGSVLSMVYEEGRVIKEEYTDVGTVVDVMIDEQTYGRLVSRLGENALSQID